MLLCGVCPPPARCTSQCQVSWHTLAAARVISFRARQGHWLVVVGLCAAPHRFQAAHQLLWVICLHSGFRPTPSPCVTLAAVSGKLLFVTPAPSVAPVLGTGLHTALQAWQGMREGRTLLNCSLSQVCKSHREDYSMVSCPPPVAACWILTSAEDRQRSAM